MIYYFGDSHTAGIGYQGCPNSDKFEPHIPYSYYLTEMLKMKSKNLARPGRNFILNVGDLISNLSEIESRAKLVIFQTQNFCNPLLRFDKFSPDESLMNLVVTSYLLNKNPDANKLVDAHFSEKDKETMINWSLKFEENRSYYEYEYIVNIFRFLTKKGIQCKILNWTWAHTIKLPENEFVFNLNGNWNALNFFNKNMKVITITQETNGEWEDGHTTNKCNRKLAKVLLKELDLKKLH